MQYEHESTITIASSLSIDELKDIKSFGHACVIDLRRDETGQAKPIEEVVLKRLRNIWIGYEQMPTDLEAMTIRHENTLFQTLCDQKGSTLVLTNQIAKLASFCMDLDIPFISSELFLVEAGAASVSVKNSDQKNRTQNGQCCRWLAAFSNCQRMPHSDVENFDGCLKQFSR